MSDQIVINRERLLVLKERLYRAKPLSGGDYQCDQWALVMQDVENMLGLPMQPFFCALHVRTTMCVGLVALK